MFAGLRRAATAKKHIRTVRLKSAPKSENKNYNHFTPIKGTRQRAEKTASLSFDFPFSKLLSFRSPLLP
jgi:hypothetical protein